MIQNLQLELRVSSSSGYVPILLMWTTNSCLIACHLFYIIHGLGCTDSILQFLFMTNSFMMHLYISPKLLDLYGALVQENG